MVAVVVVSCAAAGKHAWASAIGLRKGSSVWLWQGRAKAPVARIGRNPTWEQLPTACSYLADLSTLAACNASLLHTGSQSALQTGRTGQPTYRTGWGGPRLCVRVRVSVCVCARVCELRVVNVQGSPFLASYGDLTAYDYDCYGRLA